MDDEKLGISARRLQLFGISFGLLFAELAMIRWLGSTVTYLTFFTNLVLIACFLGMATGCLAASSRRDYTRWTLGLVLTLLATSLALNAFLARFGYRVRVAVTQETTQQVFFGVDQGELSAIWSIVVPLEVIAGAFFLLTTVAFIGVGQAMGRAFNAEPNRVLAYSINVLGSLVGIAAFGLMSWMRTPPAVWFAVVAILGLVILPRVTLRQAACAAVIAGLAGASTMWETNKALIVWSPYYKVRFDPKTTSLNVNNLGHQGMTNINVSGAGYSLPHKLRQDAGLPPLQDICIVGAGSGNDVSAALTFPVQSIDAVEIDSTLQQFGAQYHPNRPYDDARVRVQYDDARSFLSKTDRLYDAVIYAMVDSLVLHSGYSSLRLESFLFTERAFRDVKARLKPGGVFIMYNYYREGWIVGRLKALADREFGTETLVIDLPYRSSIKATDAGGFTILIAGDTAALKAKFAEKGNYFINSVPEVSRGRDGFLPPPAGERIAADAAALDGLASQPEDLQGRKPIWLQIGLTDVQTDPDAIGPLPSDDWPFLYTRDKSLPAITVRGMVMIAVLSVAVLLAVSPVRLTQLDSRMFFLGAGFMLLETKSVVHLSLLFGATWIVNSIVFAAILVMILAANLYVLWVRPRALWPYYVLLAATLIANVLIPLDTFLSLPGVTKTLASCAVVFVPLFFAGIIFAASFRDSPNPDRAFGANIAGVILGALSENLSVLLGFNQLLLVALTYYVLSYVLYRRT